MSETKSEDLDHEFEDIQKAKANFKMKLLQKRKMMNVAKDENFNEVQVSKLLKISVCETVISAELSEKFQVPKFKFEFNEAV